MSEWTSKWPTERGDYLFYGSRIGSGAKPHFQLVRVAMVTQAIEGSPKMPMVIGQEVLYERTHAGKFRPFTEKPPSLIDFTPELKLKVLDWLLAEQLAGRNVTGEDVGKRFDMTPEDAEALREVLEAQGELVLV